MMPPTDPGQKFFYSSNKYMDSCLKLNLREFESIDEITGIKSKKVDDWIKKVSNEMEIRRAISH